MNRLIINELENAELFSVEKKVSKLLGVINYVIYTFNE